MNKPNGDNLFLYIKIKNMSHKWKEDEIIFLKENYPIYGYQYCADKLNIDLQKIKGRINKLKLRLKDKTDISLFSSIKTKEVAYILGLLWADGNISNNHKNYDITLESTSEDMINIENIIMKTGNWNKYNIKGRLRNNKICKDLICYRIGFKKLYDIFYEYDYKFKSTLAPYKVLNSIPEKLKHYFFLGLVDGDGCFYINKKIYTYQFTLASTYEQDWSYMIDLCKKINISKYRVDLIQRKKSKSSTFRICRKDDIKIIGEYIYQDYSKNKIGFMRKKEKFDKLLLI